MKLFENDMAIPEKEQERIDKEREKNIDPCYTGFYMREKARPRKNYLGSPENRRSAGISIRED